jgi:hypothetical protein
MADAKLTVKTIKERDWPMTEAQCREAFKKSVGREPTESELKAMAPDRKPEPVRFIIFIPQWSFAI